MQKRVHSHRTRLSDDGGANSQPETSLPPVVGEQLDSPPSELPRVDRDGVEGAVVSPVGTPAVEQKGDVGEEEPVYYGANALRPVELSEILPYVRGNPLPTPAEVAVDDLTYRKSEPMLRGLLERIELHETKEDTPWTPLIQADLLEYYRDHLSKKEVWVITAIQGRQFRRKKKTELMAALVADEVPPVLVQTMQQWLTAARALSSVTASQSAPPPQLNTVGGLCPSCGANTHAEGVVCPDDGPLVPPEVGFDLQREVAGDSLLPPPVNLDAWWKELSQASRGRLQEAIATARSEDGTYLSPPDLRTHVMTAHPRLSMNQYMYALGALTLGQGVQALAQYEGQQQDSQDGSVVSCLHAIAKRLENPAPAPASAVEAVLKKPKQSKYEEILQEAIDAIQAPDGCGFIEFCKLASTYLQIAKYYHVAKASYSDERKIPGTDVIISAGKMLAEFSGL